MAKKIRFEIADTSFRVSPDVVRYIGLCRKKCSDCVHLNDSNDCVICGQATFIWSNSGFVPKLGNTVDVSEFRNVSLEDFIP